MLCDIKISLFINAWPGSLGSPERERGAPRCEIDASARKDCGAEESPGLNRGTVSALPVAPIHNHMKREPRSCSPFISIHTITHFNKNRFTFTTIPQSSNCHHVCALFGANTNNTKKYSYTDAPLLRHNADSDAERQQTHMSRHEVRV